MKILKRTAKAFSEKRKWAFRFLGVLFSLAIAAHAQAKMPSFTTLCYHDVIYIVKPSTLEDTSPISEAELRTHFDWLRDNGYKVVSVKDILKAKKNKTELPPKSVLLTFDDGYRSFYDTVYPLLRAYGYTALLSLETDWLETPDNEMVNYSGREKLPRSAFLSWKEIKEMADSGIVELGSHSHDLHKGEVGNPQEILLPAGAHRLYDLKTGKYESISNFKKRIRNDLEKSAKIIYKRTGYRPKVIAWPYGRYNQAGVQAALDAGYELTASLAFFADGVTIPRAMIHHGVYLPEVMQEIEEGIIPGNTAFRRRNAVSALPDAYGSRLPPHRVIHADLDMIYDPDPDQRYKNIYAFFDRIQKSKINVVYLQAFADPDGNGTADALYFPNRHLPVRMDFFNYIAWQLSKQFKCEVYAWMPVLGFDIPNRPIVEPTSPDKVGSVYTRLTPFDAKNRQIIKEIYEDLATHSYFAGIIFHDDAILGDYEDASPSGKAWLRSIGLPDDLDVIRKDPKLMQAFTRAKSRALIDFTKELQDTVEKWHQPVFTSRNMYAPAAMMPGAEEWMAQNLDDFLTTYDFTGMMAMPFMEGAADRPEAWMDELIQIVAAHPLGLRKTVFELQSRDWRPGHIAPMPNEIMVKQMQQLLANGVDHFGYYPDDPIIGHPDLGMLYPYFNVWVRPQLKK